MQVLQDLYLVRNIVKFLLPPSFLLDPSECAIPRSRWAQAVHQKLDLMSISKAWYLATWKELYADICIQRVDQLPLLVRTVAANPTIASQIRKVHHFAFIPACYGERYGELSAKLAVACKNLYAISLLYPFVEEQAPPPTVVNLLFSPPSRITHLHISDFAQSCPPSQLSNILNALATQLVSLTLLPIYNLQVDAGVPLSFPVLTHLRWDQAYIDLVTLSSNWQLPSLQYVTIHQEQVRFPVFIQFFRRHGNNVTYLAFPPTRMWDVRAGRYSPPPYEIDQLTFEEERMNFFEGKQPIYCGPHAVSLGRVSSKDVGMIIYSPPSSSEPNLCPALIHLVLPPDAVIHPFPPPYHSTIQHIDIWSNSHITRQGMLNVTKCNFFRILDPTGNGVPADGESIEMVDGVPNIGRSARFPALGSIRTISRVLEGFPNLPLDIPPVDGFPQIALELFKPNGRWREAHIRPNVTSVIDCVGMQVEYGVGCILEVEPVWPDSYDEREDPLYEPPPKGDPAWDTDPSSDSDTERSANDSPKERPDGDDETADNTSWVGELDDDIDSDSDHDSDLECGIADAEMERLPSIDF